MDRYPRLNHLIHIYGKRNNSRLVLALDVTRSMYRPEAVETLLNKVSRKILGVKIGLPTILSYGLGEVARWIVSTHDILWIADIKLADVGHIARSMIELVSEAGFDAVIIHGFIGFYGGVVEAVKASVEHSLSPILVAAMSHQGAEEYVNKFSADIVLKSLEYPVDGYVLPATYPKYIKMFRGIVGDRVILSPGVGVQGAPPGSAVESGADAEIIGRTIYMDVDPIKKVDELRGVLTWHR